MMRVGFMCGGGPGGKDHRRNHRIRSRWGQEQAGAACLLFGCSIHEAAQGWFHVRCSHLAAGAWKAKQGFVAWDV